MTGRKQAIPATEADAAAWEAAHAVRCEPPGDTSGDRHGRAVAAICEMHDIERRYEGRPGGWAEALRLHQARVAAAEAQLEEWIQRQLATAPPLSQWQRDRIASLFDAQRAETADLCQQIYQARGSTS